MKTIHFIWLILLLPACSPRDGVVQGCNQIELGQFVTLEKGVLKPPKQPIYSEEYRDQSISIDAFEIMQHEVTNSEFAEFVAATDYKTDAELSHSKPDGGSALFKLPQLDVPGTWALEKGATWRTPQGAGSNIQGLDQHPVVHVSYRDALAYAQWKGARLPTEAEWEYAAKLGLPDPDKSDSGAYDEQGKPLANTWQGLFPVVNTNEDNFASTAPAGCYPPNRLGIYDMIGNVWEWTSTPYNTPHKKGDDKIYTIKGGSFLCANNFCQRYRPVARQAQEHDFSTNHIGFRLARDL